MGRRRFSGEWETRQLGEIAAITMGQSPASASYNVIGEGLPLIQGKADIFGRATVHRTWTSAPSKLCEAGDIVLTVRAPVGAVAIASKDACLGRGVCGVKPLIDSQFLYCALIPLESQWEGVGQGSTFSAADSRQVASFLVVVPSDRSEQRAIAAVLMDVDALIGSLEALIAKKRAIKRAAMQQLLTGRTRLPGFDGVWETRRIDALAEVDPENLPSSTGPGFVFNYISLDDVDAGRLLGYSRESFATAPSRARRVVRDGDVLMSTVRPALQGHLLFCGQVPNAICSTGFAVLRTKRTEGDSRFLFAHLLGDVVAAQVQSLLAGSNYPAINSGDVAGLRVTCPRTLAEQRAIAAVLSDMDAEIAALESRLDKTCAIKQGMMQQLLTGAVRLPIPDYELEGESDDA